MSGGNIKGTGRPRSVVEILISTVRSQAEATLQFERMLADRVDEFTIARCRRVLVDGAAEAQATADMAERLHRAAVAALPPSLRSTHADQPEPPSEPPPKAA